MAPISAPFPSEAFFSELVARAAAQEDAMVRLGIAELRFGAEIVNQDGTARLFGIDFDGYDVASLGEVDEAAYLPEVVVTGPLEVWVEMIEAIEAGGAADPAHSLNSLTIAGVPLDVRSSDAMGSDKFYRYMGTIQAVFDAAGAKDVEAVV